MHELGVVFHMRDLLLEVADEQGLSRITRVVVDLGEVSGVVDELMADAWRWTCDKSDVLQDAQLQVNRIEAATVCNACGRTYRTLDHGRVCPHCASADTVLLRGQELEIREIEAY